MKLIVGRNQDWMKQAERDLQNTKFEMGVLRGTCFLSQQAAEKALKAVYQRLSAEAQIF